jgi:hypothetical protein
MGYGVRVLTLIIVSDEAGAGVKDDSHEYVAWFSSAARTPIATPELWGMRIAASAPRHGSSLSSRVWWKCLSRWWSVSRRMAFDFAQDDVCIASL